ncbi:MAG: hypothetical protein ACRD36_07220, partial [Candidatus Acidiferrum sp.]
MLKNESLLLVVAVTVLAPSARLVGQQPIVKNRGRMLAVSPPLGQKAALADMVIVGKVASIDEKPQFIKRTPRDPEKSEYRVANVKIEQLLLGGANLTHVRVGYLAHAADADPTGANRIPGLSDLLQIKLSPGQEAIFFLQSHSVSPLFVLNYVHDLVDKSGNPDFNGQLAELKHCTELLAEPKAALRSANGGDRFLT